MGQFMYIACLECKSCKWLDKLSLEFRKNQLCDFMRFEHYGHTFKLFGEGSEDESLLNQFHDADECSHCKDENQ